jgi:hypothetical protein
MGKRGLCFFRQVNLQKANIPDGFFLKQLGSQRYGQFQNRSFIYKFPFLRGFGALKIPSQSTQRGSSQVLSSHALSSPAAGASLRGMTIEEDGLFFFGDFLTFGGLTATSSGSAFSIKRIADWTRSRNEALEILSRLAPASRDSGSSLMMWISRAVRCLMERRSKARSNLSQMVSPTAELMNAFFWK